ncbi:MAG: alpha-hydroxy-acid oxidizing protein [bacterium]
MGADGERGLNRVIELVINEISLTMAQLGCSKVQHINQSVLAKL